MMKKEESKLGGEDLSSNDLLYRTKTKEALLCLIKKKSQFHEQHSKKKKKDRTSPKRMHYYRNRYNGSYAFFF